MRATQVALALLALAAAQLTGTLERTAREIAPPTPPRRVVWQYFGEAGDPFVGTYDAEKLLNVDTADAEMTLPENPDHSRYVRMVYADGTPYLCKVPPPPEKAAEESLNKEQAADMAVNFIRSALDGICMYKVSGGWFSYELCYGKSFRQYHEENGKTVVEYFLGRAPPEGHRVASLVPGKYFEEVYRDGSVCDITGRARETQLHFMCASDNAADVVLLTITELSSCVYTVLVHVKALCDHPLLRPHETDVTAITCFTEEPPPGECSASAGPGAWRQPSRRDSLLTPIAAQSSPGSTSLTLQLQWRASWSS
eukprot:TRINITY_DN3817_c0_g1_i2.p1 TRINITY_DN3817_c0_g1~~TRINITY_DN3817_c0_g1_i2.p1  ORF type:complete len:311 (+),score=75.62 TRINITY_DN3817_c0_g1_i2:39-971(+)